MTNELKGLLKELRTQHEAALLIGSNKENSIVTQAVYSGEAIAYDYAIKRIELMMREAKLNDEIETNDMLSDIFDKNFPNFPKLRK